MPTYQYLCKNCGNEIEELQSMSEPPLTKCPQCGEHTLARVMGAGSGVIFKGSGFYLTDYAKKAETKSSGNESKKDEKKTGETAKPGKEDTKPKTPPAPKPTKE